jgi:hypothetical protein
MIPSQNNLVAYASTRNLIQYATDAEEIRTPFVALDSEYCDKNSMCNGYSLKGDYLVHEAVIGSDDKWEDEYLELDLTLSLGEYSDKNRFMMSYALEINNLVEIGTFTRTESNDVHFTGYKQKGTLESTKGNTSGRHRDAKTWQG